MRLNVANDPTKAKQRRGDDPADPAPVSDEYAQRLERNDLGVTDYRAAGSTNPYDRVNRAGEVPTRTSQTTRTDLRKLSEWIKLKRELEARKQQGDDGDD